MNHTGRVIKGHVHGPALTALLLGLTVYDVAMAEPKPLADAEMDSVTAAGVVVEVDAYAWALGAIATARTEARVLTRSTKERVEVAAGFAEGLAYACCGEESSITVGSKAAGGGDVAYGSTFSQVFHGASLTSEGKVKRFTFGYSASLVVAASSDAVPHFLESNAELSDTLAALSREVIGDQQSLSDDGLAAGFAFAPMYTAALRWRAAHHLIDTQQGVSWR
jgi:hypothetical protein